MADTKVVTERGEESVKVLDIDPGEATNKTVVTFVGSPEENKLGKVENIAY